MSKIRYIERVSLSSIPPLPAPKPAEMPDGASYPLFPAAPRPDQAVAHRAWQAALAEIEENFGKPGLIAVIGAPGSGKTLLLHAVAERVLAAGGVAALFQPMPVPGSRRPDVVLIDDAGRLTASMLRALAQQGRPMVVAGGQDLAERLQDAGVPAVLVTLGPLTPDDAAAFLEVQLAAAERSAELIQPAALMQLVQRSNGVPRNLQMLAGLSVFVARLADAPQVTPAHVEQAALIQTGTEPGDDDADGDDDGPIVSALPRPSPAPPARPLPAPVLPAPVLPAPALPTPALPTPGQPWPVQPVLASPATMLLAPPQRRLGGWAMAALSLGALGAGAGAGWLLIPHVLPLLLSLTGPAAGRPPTSLAAVDPRPALLPGPSVPATPRAAVAPMDAVPAAAPARPSAPRAGADAQPVPRPPQPSSGQPVPPPAAPVATMAPDPAVRNQPLPDVVAPPTAATPAAPSQQALATPAPALPEPPSAAPAAASEPVMPAAPGMLAVPGLTPPARWVRPAVQALPLPTALPLHVAIYYDDADGDAGAQAASLAKELGRRGYQVPPPEPGAVRGEPTVSYVFAEDAPAAAALAYAIGVEAIQVRPGAEPRPGAIRVALTSAGTGRFVVNPQSAGSKR